MRCDGTKIWAARTPLTADVVGSGIYRCDLSRCQSADNTDPSAPKPLEVVETYMGVLAPTGTRVISAPAQPQPARGFDPIVIAVNGLVPGPNHEDQHAPMVVARSLDDDRDGNGSYVRFPVVGYDPTNPTRGGFIVINDADVRRFGLDPEEDLMLQSVDRGWHLTVPVGARMRTTTVNDGNVHQPPPVNGQAQPPSLGMRVPYATGVATSTRPMQPASLHMLQVADVIPPKDMETGPKRFYTEHFHVEPELLAKANAAAALGDHVIPSAQATTALTVANGAQPSAAQIALKELLDSPATAKLLKTLKGSDTASMRLSEMRALPAGYVVRYHLVRALQAETRFEMRNMDSGAEVAGQMPTIHRVLLPNLDVIRTSVVFTGVKPNDSFGMDYWDAANNGNPKPVQWCFNPGVPGGVEDVVIGLPTLSPVGVAAPPAAAP